MIKIAHRGNVRGPSEQTENNPVDIVIALSLGYDVEVDIWMDDSGIYLGHDKPDHKIDETFIEDIKENAWFHCKNIEALGYFTHNMPDAKFFWHQEDDYTLTSNGYIWTYPGKTVTSKSIIVINEKTDLSKYQGAYGICYDYFNVES